MKTKKVLALVVLAAFLISIVPFAAFGAYSYSQYASSVKAPTETVEAQPVTTGAAALAEDGAEFTVVLNQASGFPVGAPVTLDIATSRPGIDFLSFKDPLNSTWTNIPFTSGVGTYTFPAASVVAGMYNITVEFKVVSNTDGISNIAFGDNTTGAVAEYAKGESFTSGSLADIIKQKKFPVEFTPARANDLQVRLGDGYNFVVYPLGHALEGQFDRVNSSIPAAGIKPANGVDTYKVQAFVYANNVPVAGKDVNFSISSGSGLSLTAAKATTDVTGKAEVKVYATKASGTTPFKIAARTSGVAFASNTLTSPSTHETYVVFNTPGITSIKAESDNNQKVARDAGNFTLKFSAYDASGNRVAISEPELNQMTRTVVTKPSGSGISDSKGSSGSENTQASLNFRLATRSDGDAEIVIDTTDLKKDGEYEVKVHLTNGSSVSYKFSAKEQGDVVKMELDYGSDSYAGESLMPRPSIKYYDAEGYKVTKDFGTNPSTKATTGTDVKLSISDASFIAAGGSISINDGSFQLRDDKSGVITMTAVDTTKNLVATQVLNIHKPASYLKLTPQSVGAVGGEVTVNIELVDVDGKLAATGISADTSRTSATIIAKPEGAVASADTVNVNNFTDGKASVKVSSNMEGDVTLQVIITEQGGKTYTGACTVSFGKASAGAGQVIFIVGAPSYVSGNKVFAAESPSFIDNGRTFLGVRDMGTSIGATIEWDQASQTATLSKDGVTIKVTVGANKIAVTKNGVTSEIEIDAPAQNKNGRVYLPFRAVMEAFNYTVTFDQATNSIVCAL